MTEEELIFRAYQRGLLRRLIALKSADQETAAKLLDGLIEDTKADIAD